jgi:hypothetical protein
MMERLIVSAKNSQTIQNKSFYFPHTAENNIQTPDSTEIKFISHKKSFIQTMQSQTGMDQHGDNIITKNIRVQLKLEITQIYI